MGTSPEAVGTLPQSVMLVAEPVAVSEARAWLASRAAALVEDERLANLALVVSEIVTNAVRHGKPGGHIRLAATPKDDYLCVQVTDEGDGFASSPGAMASEAHGGFGLYLVEQLTRRWGMTREDMHTRVWFEFDYGAA